MVLIFLEVGMVVGGVGRSVDIWRLFHVDWYSYGCCSIVVDQSTIVERTIDLWLNYGTFVMDGGDA